MITLRSVSRLAALAFGAIVASSCDTRLPTQSSGAQDDVLRPTITFVLRGGTNNAVVPGATASVDITTSDNKGVSTILTTVRNSSQVIGIDTVTFKPTSLTSTRTVPVPLDGAKKGDRIIIRTTATDAALNTRTDSLIVSVAAPSISFDTPVVGSKVNVGDSLLVTARLHDDAGIKQVTFLGYSLRGSARLGTQDTIIRYPLIGAPTLSANFAANVRDTVIQRYLKVQTPIDTTTDSLVVRGILTDVLGGADTARVSVKIVRGPNVQVLSPVAGDSATPGAGLTITLRATDPTGVSRLGFRLQSDASFPTKIDTTIVAGYANAPKDVTFTATVAIPANAPPKAVLTITPVATNVGGQDGASAPTLIAVRAGLPPAPRVFQTIASRVEVTDSLSITALGNGVKIVGYELRDASGIVLKRDSVAIASPFPSTAVVTIPLNLSTAMQGKRISLISFAYDQGGRVGYSLQAGATAFQPNAAAAFRDSSLVVYGRTYALPATRNGTIADLTVDQARGNVFLSNINFGRLEVWQKGIGNFDPTGVVVGSQPWGMTMSRTAAGKDTLYVANSGGTNLSRVYIGASSPSGMREDLSNRLLTRVSFLYKATETRDIGTGKIRISVTGPFLFSDRPQYVEQSASGRLYISTKPTVAAPSGTTRYLDPAAPAPDERFILDFATQGTDPNSFLIANVDSMGVIPAPASSTSNDVLVMCDHSSGTTAGGSCVSSAGGILATITALKTQEPKSDVEYKVNADEKSLGLTDTTYAASSGDGQWITFGEGNRAPTARNFLLKDDGSVAGRYTYASPSINVADLINNASDRIFGVALDKSGKTIGIHGGETYFATTNIPFTQRLQGKKSTFSVGAGIAFHPNADGVTTPQAQRLAFVASNNGSIEAVDIAYYDFSRGALATKFNLYGPLRASLPFPGDDASVIVKLFGMSAKGLVVIDVTAADLIAGP